MKTVKRFELLRLNNVLNEIRIELENENDCIRQNQLFFLQEEVEIKINMVVNTLNQMEG